MQKLDKLIECALLYKQLIGTDYVISAQKSNNVIKVITYFSEANFFHLLGIQKLVDVPELKTLNKANVFEMIISGKITYDTISSSVFIESVDERIQYFSKLHELLDNDIILKYDKRKAYSDISATMMVYKKYDEVYLHLFFNSRDDKSQVMIPCSFFPRKDNKYIAHQEVYKIIGIEKIEHGSKLKEQSLSDRISNAHDRAADMNQRQEKQPARNQMKER